MAYISNSAFWSQLLDFFFVKRSFISKSTILRSLFSTLRVRDYNTGFVVGQSNSCCPYIEDMPINCLRSWSLMFVCPSVCPTRTHS